MRRIIGKLFFLFCLFFISTANAQETDYLIAGGDVLRISVYDYPDLNTTVRVSKNGTISFPLLGEINVKELTAHQARKKIADLLSKGIIMNPQVTVFIEKFKTKRVTVIGEVVKPGQYEISPEDPAYVADMISLCLGLTGNAGESLTILRKNGKEPKKISINLNDVLQNGDLSQNIQVQDGDVLSIHRVGYFYIYGEVKRAGYYKIEPGLTVIKAISKAEGLTPIASTKGIRLIRLIDGQERTINVELNSPVLASDNFFSNGDMSQNLKIEKEDVIYVPKAAFFYVFGEVKNPGSYKMEPELTVINALSMAGGVTLRASTKTVTILRRSQDRKISIDAQLEQPIQEEDIIIVKESFF